MIVDDVEYVDEEAELFPDGTVHDATLARDADIQGIPCRGGRSVVFFPSGRLKLAWLYRTAIIAGVPCSSCIVYLHENGRVQNATLATRHDFAGVIVSADARVTLDESGRLLEYWRRLDSEEVIGGLHCSPLFHVWLYPDGRPSSVVLSSPAVVGAHEYPRGANLFLSETGEVLDWQPVDLDSGRRYKQRLFGVFQARWV